MFLGSSSEFWPRLRSFCYVGEWEMVKSLGDGWRKRSFEENRQGSEAGSLLLQALSPRLPALFALTRAEAKVTQRQV